MLPSIEKLWIKKVSSQKIDFRNLTRFRDQQQELRMPKMPLEMLKMMLVMSLRELMKFRISRMVTQKKKRMKLKAWLLGAPSARLHASQT